MCGIIAVIAKNGDLEKAREAMLEQYENQHDRGTRGFGLIEVTKGGTRVRKATEPTKALIDVVRSDAPILLFHHRFPTSTENTLDQAHPMFVSNEELSGDWYVCHNGTLRNQDELRKQHEKLGYVYRTITNSKYNNFEKFNDSEAFAIDLVRFLEGKTAEMDHLGPAAFIGVKIDKATKKPVNILFGRGNGNPLNIKETADNLIIASDIPGKGVIIHPEKVASILQLKAINSPNLWPKDSADDMPLFSMSNTMDLKIAVPPTIKTTPYRNTTGVGFQPDKVTNHRLLEEGRKEGITQRAFIKKEDEVEEETEAETDATPRQIAFAKMAERTLDRMAPTIEMLFEQLSEGDLDDTDMNSYMFDLQKIIKERFAGARRFRHHADRFEESQMQRDLRENHAPSTNIQDPLDHALNGMLG